MPTIDDIDQIHIRRESRQVQDVIRRINNKTYILDPDFQRDFVWTRVQQSKLIESILMRIPLPVFYLLEIHDGHIMIVDGLQRLSTFHRFRSNELALHLKDNEELNGRKFSDLGMKLQERFLECNLTVYIIDSSVSEERCYDIFQRVNSGQPLTSQQMRNCLCNGPGTRFLRSEVQTEIFRKATGGSLKSKTMQDREYVNRFCAFQVLTIEEYRDLPRTDRIDSFLSRCLRTMNKWNEEELHQLSERFRLSLRNNYELFGAHAFRKSFLKHESVTKSQRNRSSLVIPLWDVMTTGLSRYPLDDVRASSDRLRNAYRRLLNDPTFTDSIENFHHTPDKVTLRFEFVDKMLRGILSH